MFYEGLALRFTGSTIEGARFLWALLGIVTVPVAFLLASRGGGTKVGLVAAALLAAYHFHIHFSRTALNNIADPFFLAVAVYCLLNAVERKSFFSWAIVGAITGLALYFYQGARLTPVVLAIVLVFWAVRQGRRFRARLGWGPLVALGAFLVSAAPMLQYAVRFPDEFNARVNQISVLQPGWFAQETVRTGLQGYQIMWNQLTHALLAFNIFPDTSPTYKLQTPLLDPLFGLVFLLGLLHSTFAVLVDQRYWRLAPLVIWWWSGVVIGDALTFNPPTSQRMITVAVPVCIFIALALDLLLRALRQLRFNIPPVPALVTSVFLFAVISLKTYFIDYNPQHLAGSKTDDVIMALTPELRALRPQATVLFAGAAAMYWKPPTWTYLAPQATGADLPPLTGPLSVTALKPGQQALFIFLPFRMDDLAFVQQTFPNGVLQTVTDPVDQQVLATTYKVER